MRTIILYNDKLARILLMRGYHTITIGPFVITTKKRSEVNPCIIRHERTHVHQWAEITLLCMWAVLLCHLACDVSMWWTTVCPVIFYVWYVTEYLIRCLAGHGTQKEAYRSIAFEQEAYANEQDEKYLDRRNLFAFARYY